MDLKLLKLVYLNRRIKMDITAFVLLAIFLTANYFGKE